MSRRLMNIAVGLLILGVVSGCSTRTGFIFESEWGRETKRSYSKYEVLELTESLKNKSRDRMDKCR